ncbi:60S ribosomal protein L29-like [Neovison vison]|uniref:60S ribosomal protein L29-like n=1 Tax=Neovison vison TaxID=452646 RepID=UPI001CF032ED|nr:60S ribosomal protein L29-like [Neogale vison]
MGFAKKHNKKGWKKMQVINTKVMCARAKAITGLKTPKWGSHKLNQLACIARSKLGEPARVCIARDLGLCSPKSKTKAQTKAQAAAVTPAPGTHKGSSAEASVLPSVRTEGLIGPVGFCVHGAGGLLCYLYR